MCCHPILRSGGPAGAFPPAFHFWAGDVKNPLSRTAQLS
jgi:hypothetical protein